MHRAAVGSAPVFSHGPRSPGLAPHPRSTRLYRSHRFPPGLCPLLRLRGGSRGPRGLRKSVRRSQCRKRVLWPVQLRRAHRHLSRHRTGRIADRRGGSLHAYRHSHPSLRRLPPGHPRVWSPRHNSFHLQGLGPRGNVSGSPPARRLRSGRLGETRRPPPGHSPLKKPRTSPSTWATGTSRSERSPKSRTLTTPFASSSVP